MSELVDLKSETLLRVLECYGSPMALAKSTDSDNRALMKSIGRGLLTMEKIDAVLCSAKETVGVDVSDSEAEELRLLSREMRRVKEGIKEKQKELNAAAEDIDCVQNIKSLVGSTTAVVLYTCLGDPASYTSAAAYMKAAGLNLKEHSSGKKKGQLAISKRGPGLPRLLLYFAAMRLVQSDPMFQTWHKRKVARSGPRQGKKSIIALARKLIRALWHVGRGSEFDANRLFNMPQAISVEA